MNSAVRIIIIMCVSVYQQFIIASGSKDLTRDVRKSNFHTMMDLTRDARKSNVHTMMDLTRDADFPSNVYRIFNNYV